MGWAVALPFIAASRPIGSPTSSSSNLLFIIQPPYSDPPTLFFPFPLVPPSSSRSRARRQNSGSLTQPRVTTQLAGSGVTWRRLPSAENMRGRKTERGGERRATWRRDEKLTTARLVEVEVEWLVEEETRNTQTDIPVTYFFCNGERRGGGGRQGRS